MEMRTTLASAGNLFLWTYIYGPILAFLPQRWRLMWFGNRPVIWPRATIVSGILQIVVGFCALVIWTGWETCNIGSAMGTGCGPGAFQFFSLVLAALHPVTWVMFYLLFEGFARVFAVIFMHEAPGTAILGAYLYFRDRMTNSDPPIPDEVIEEISNEGWKLRIESCRPKREWNIGRLLFYKERYYRIASFSMKPGPRPYVFTLETVPAGVKSRSVIIYSLDACAPVSGLSPQPR
jgi:hypothetical protein